MDESDPLAPFEAFGSASPLKLSRMQKIVAARMAQNWTAIPHVTHHDEADVTILEAYRNACPPDRKLTALVFLIKAVALTLRSLKQFNVSLASDSSTLVVKDYVHIGIAVDVEGGLLVPVLRDCDRRSLRDLGKEVQEVSSEARGKGLPYDRMTGGCFTISSLGGIGGTGFTPIINAPEVAILGVSRTVVRPMWDGEAFQPRSMLPLSLSYDHRIINGADAARFCREIADRLGDPQSLE